MGALKPAIGSPLIGARAALQPAAAPLSSQPDGRVVVAGNFLRVKALRYDCDLDAVLALVEPAGPACHTGERTCFHNGDLAPAAHEALPALERTIDERAAAGDTGGSYTARLLADPDFAGEKVREEAEEVTRAVREETDERVAEEAADVLYHLTVLLRTRGLRLADAERVLLERRR